MITLWAWASRSDRWHYGVIWYKNMIWLNCYDRWNRSTSLLFGDCIPPSASDTEEKQESRKQKTKTKQKRKRSSSSLLGDHILHSALNSRGEAGNKKTNRSSSPLFGDYIPPIQTQRKSRNLENKAKPTGVSVPSKLLHTATLTTRERTIPVRSHGWCTYWCTAHPISYLSHCHRGGLEGSWLHTLCLSVLCTFNPRYSGVTRDRFKLTVILQLAGNYRPESASCWETTLNAVGTCSEKKKNTQRKRGSF